MAATFLISIISSWKDSSERMVLSCSVMHERREGGKRKGEEGEDEPMSAMNSSFLFFEDEGVVSLDSL
jgi:hypothetical protein